MNAKFGADLELPPELRAIAEKNVAQARQAFDTLFDTARTAVGESEGRLDEVRSNIKELRQKTIGLVESNVNASFEFMQKLVKAKSPQDVFALQAEFLKQQVQSISTQAAAFGNDARSLGETTVRTLDEHARALAERVKALGATAAEQAKTATADFQAAGAAVAQSVQENLAKATTPPPSDPNKTY